MPPTFAASRRCIPDRPAHREYERFGLPATVRPTARAAPRWNRMLSMNAFMSRARCRSSRLPSNVRPLGRNDRRYVRLAQPRRRLDQRIEHRLQIEGRAADDLEHVGGGGLLLQRFAQLVEQAGVLDGDDGLGGEVRDQLDLLVGERPHLLAVDGDGADKFVLLEHRHGEWCERRRIDDGDEAGIALDVGRFRPHVGDVDRPAWSRRRGRGRVPVSRGQTRFALPLLGKCRRNVVQRGGAERISLDAATDCRTWPRRCASRSSSMAWNTGSSSPGELEMTRSTSEVAVCCSSASESSRVRACTSSNSRTFSIAITAWSAKVVDQLDLLVGEGAHLQSPQDDQAEWFPFAHERHA